MCHRTIRRGQIKRLIAALKHIKIAGYQIIAKLAYNTARGSINYYVLRAHIDF